MPFSFGDDTINAGDVVSLQCTVAKGDSPITIAWFFNNTEIETTDEIVLSRISKKVSALTIESARASHVGEYTCVAKNAAGATNFSATLLVNVLPQIMPFSFGDETINAGDVVSVTCTVAKGDSPITISWFFNGTEIESTDDITISKISRKISSLSIDSARADHMGEYTCVAKNAAGASNFSTMLHIQVLPQIIPFSAGEDTINAGDAVSLQCSVSKGDSPISISWLFNNSEVQIGDDVVISKVSKKVSTLIIESARENHIGAYTCVAKNAAGANNFTSYLHINVLPQIMPFSFGDESTNAGDLVSVQCTVTKGDSPIAISWLFNGSEIESTDEITISKNSKKISALTIESVQASQMGEYTCIAKNAAGSSNYTTHLHINGF
ncbi:Hypothetical predicted protein [Cloeon dipterum]|uniref:Ig-like domain-containing protein n=1 Tax=Cloeon dipterum TaxID=197152 RepID=A0A8S1BXG5_9INSE|nr:Hypothetical predicted protein [Cloeon dipterum]